MKREVHTAHSINLVRKNSSFRAEIAIILSFLALLAAVLTAVYFLMIPAYNSLSGLRSHRESALRELEALREANADFGDVAAMYTEYGTGYLTDDERMLADRDTVLDKIDEYIISNGAVMKYRLSGNDLSATVFDVSLWGASDMIGLLTADELISYAATRTASNMAVYSNGAGREPVRVPTIELKVCFADRE